MAELLTVKNLKKYFPIRGGLFSKEVARVHAVDDVSFGIVAGETLGLVGESGCGKSTTGRTILRLIEPTSGEVWFQDKDVTAMDKRTLRALRKEMQIIFQDPYASLNPRMTVGSIIGEALVIHKLAPNRKAREERVVQLLRRWVSTPSTAALSPRVLRGPAPAHRDRPRARRQPEAHRGRRARVRPGRVRPGPGHQPARGPAGASAWPICSSRTTSRSWSTSPRAWR